MDMVKYRLPNGTPIVVKGEYITRDGQLAVIDAIEDDQVGFYPIRGRLGSNSETWNATGKWSHSSGDHARDLVAQAISSKQGRAFSTSIPPPPPKRVACRHPDKQSCGGCCPLPKECGAFPCVACPFNHNIDE